MVEENNRKYNVLRNIICIYKIYLGENHGQESEIPKKTICKQKIIHANFVRIAFSIKFF